VLWPVKAPTRLAVLIALDLEANEHAGFRILPAGSDGPGSKHARHVPNHTLPTSVQTPDCFAFLGVCVALECLRGDVVELGCLDELGEHLLVLR
jgi:hypothetical protein